MPSIFRSILRPFGLLMLVLVAFQASFAPAAGEPIGPAYITFEPNPPPANQVFSGVLHRQGHPGSLGFFVEPSGVARHRITADSIDFLFDTGCGFLCPPLPPAVVASSFTLPPLPAGSYRVRVVSEFGDSPNVLADVAIVVGGVTPRPVGLPLGGTLGNALLGALVALVGVGMLSRRKRRQA